MTIYLSSIANHYSCANLEPTINGYGSMHPLSKFSETFIDRCSQYKKPVIDIGCAYGVAVIPALKRNATVIAIDIDERHLDILQQRVPDEFVKRLICLTSRFPHDIDFLEASISCVHLSLILSFLNGDEVREGIKRISRWLNIDGEVFIINHTPFVKMIESYLPSYEDKKKNNDPWPGYIEDITEKGLENNYTKNIPKTAHQFDIDTLVRELELNDLFIEVAEYFTIPNLPNEYKLDGKEFVGVIARKK